MTVDKHLYADGSVRVNGGSMDRQAGMIPLVPKSGWRARCAATDDLLLAAMLAAAVIGFVGGFFLFVGELAELMMHLSAATQGEE